jgi:hypothetical protein
MTADETHITARLATATSEEACAESGSHSPAGRTGTCREVYRLYGRVIGVAG